MTAQRALRIVELVNTTEHGGVEEHVRELAVGLSRGGDHVTIVCPSSPPADRLARSAAEGGVEVRRLQLSAQHGRSGAWKRASTLRRLLIELRPDVLHIHLTGYTGGRLAVIAGSMAGVRGLVCTSHLAPMEPPPVRVRVERLLLNLRVERFLAVSQDTMERQVRFLGQPRRRSAAVHNGVDVKRFQPLPDRNVARRALHLPADAPVIGAVGRLVEQKSLDTLVEALPTILASSPEAHVVIVGDGPLRGRLQDLAARLGVAGRLHIAGFRSDIPACLAAMDLFVLPSIYEGLPIAVLEAMAAGLPVVATRVNGVPEAVVDGRTGRLVSPREPEELAGAVIALLSDPESAKAMGQAGKARVASVFSNERFVASTRAEYEKAIDSRRGSSQLLAQMRRVQ